jgi:hypothetical protein
MKSLGGTPSLIAAIKPLRYVSSMFGLANFSAIEDKLHRRKRSAISWSLIWTCVWIVLLAASSYLQLSNYIFYSPPGTPIKVIILNTVYVISLNLTCFVSFCLCSAFRTHQIFEIIDKLELMTSTFMKTVDNTVTYGRTKILVLLEVTVVLVVNIFVDTAYAYFSCDHNLWNCLSAVTESFGCVCISLVIVQFVTVVLILRERCKYINCILSKVSEDALIYPMKMFQTCEAVESPGIETYILPPRSHGNRLSRKQVMQCRLFFAELKSVSRLICFYYGFPILLATFWIFTNIVNVLYIFFYYQSTGYYKDDYSKYAHVFDCIMWCVFCAMLMIIMALSCHLTMEEPNITMSHVQNLLLRQNLDDETIEELSKFSSQLSMTKIEITACGFFVLNLQFLYGFFGVTFAYFVIMFQIN